MPSKSTRLPLGNPATGPQLRGKPDTENDGNFENFGKIRFCVWNNCILKISRKKQFCKKYVLMMLIEGSVGQNPLKVVTNMLDPSDAGPKFSKFPKC